MLLTNFLMTLINKMKTYFLFKYNNIIINQL